MALRFSPSRGAASFVLGSMVRGPTGPAGANVVDGPKRRVTAVGGVSVNGATDQVIRIAKTIEAATPVYMPTVAARIGGLGGPVFIINEMSNGALYPLTITPSGGETIQGQSTYTMDGQRQGLWFWPDDTVTPNNWEIR